MKNLVDQNDHNSGLQVPLKVGDLVYDYQELPSNSESIWLITNFYSPYADLECFDPNGRKGGKKGDKVRNISALRLWPVGTGPDAAFTAKWQNPIAQTPAFPNKIKLDPIAPFNNGRFLNLSNQYDLYSGDLFPLLIGQELFCVHLQTVLGGPAGPVTNVPSAPILYGPSGKKDPNYPHQCPYCGAASFNGFTTVDCTAKCGALKHV